MKRFHYTAVDRQGQPVTGYQDAEDWSAAARALAEQGYTSAVQTGVETLKPLSTAEAVELAGYLSELSRSGLPLGGTLRELGHDTPSVTLRRVIDELAQKLDAGQPLDVALDALGVRLPEHVRRLLVAAARSGQLSEALQQLLDHQQATDDMGRRLRQAIAYPAVLLALLVGWLVFIALDVTPQLASLFDDMGVDNHNWSLALLSFSQWLPWLMAAIAIAAAGIVGLCWLIGGTAALSCLLAKVPLIGPCWSYRGLADFAGYLGEFLDQRLPLDEALSLSAIGARDPAIRVASRRAAGRVTEGGSLAQALDAEKVFPQTLVRWAEWGQDHVSIPEAMRAAGAAFRERFELRYQLVRVFVPAIVFGLIAGCALLVAGGVMQVMFSLITSLSSWSPTPQNQDSFYNVLIASTMLGVVIVGLSLLAVAPLLRARGYVADAFSVVMRFAGLVLLAVALLIGSVLLMGPWGLVVWLLIAAVGIRGILRYRQVQKQALWSALSLAADRRVPLAPMARAFADEHGGAIGMAARDLARQLESGADLSEAALWTWSALPREAPLALRIGTDSGDLTGALRAARGGRGNQPLMPASLAWMAFFLPPAIGLVAFISIKIVPSFMVIFRDFDSELPPLTLMIVAILGDGYLLPLLGLALGILLLLVWLQWRGTLTPRLPVVRNVVRWFELAPVLRMLALVTRRDQPLAGTIATLGRLHPKRWMRRRLRAAAADVEQGYSWQESLRRRRLLAANDLAVLAAAERNGNLPWALEELAASYHRRAEFRLRAWNEFALPMALLVVGICVALFVTACFVPLVQLIIHLT